MYLVFGGPPCGVACGDRTTSFIRDATLSIDEICAGGDNFKEIQYVYGLIQRALSEAAPALEPLAKGCPS